MAALGRSFVVIVRHDRLIDISLCSDIASKIEVIVFAMKDNFGFVYVIQGTQGDSVFFKIGSTRDIKRIIDLDSYLFSVQHPFKIDIELAMFSIVPCYKPEKLECAIHGRFADKRVIGEWFDLDKGCLDNLRDIEFFRSFGEQLWGDSARQDDEVLRCIEKARKTPRLGKRDVDLWESFIFSEDSIVARSQRNINVKSTGV